MSDPDTDRELLEATWRAYDNEFAEYVGTVVTPYEYLDTEAQVNWAARIFMFAYALGSLAGAQAVEPDGFDGETDLERVETVVDHVIDVHASEEFAASSGRIREDFLE
jgi:hypothetical protein